MKTPETSIRLDTDLTDRETGENSMDLISSFDSKPDLKMPIKHGVFLWGSNRLAEWVHPDEQALAEEIVPGYRVFRREPCLGQLDRDDGYARLWYGQQSFRAKPIVWLEVEPEGFAVGDRVEVKSEYGKRQPGLATIVEMKWNRYEKRIEYSLRGNDLTLERIYHADELRSAVELNDSAGPELAD
jgi:hypothetical protein